LTLGGRRPVPAAPGDREACDAPDADAGGVIPFPEAGVAGAVAGAGSTKPIGAADVQGPEDPSTGPMPMPDDLPITARSADGGTRGRYWCCIVSKEQ